MRRAVSLAALLVVIAGVVVAVLGRGGGDRGRVDVVFDDAKGLVPGQAVKVAGATAGEVTAVRLAPTRDGGYRARLRLAVDRRFLPFHADARCSILPAGVISENYVDCDPGTDDRPALGQVRGVPLVRVAHTSVPTSLQDVLNIFAAPTSQRLRILVNELGIATAGRGADLNALLRRVNPALTQTRRVFGILDRQAGDLTDGVTQTDKVLAELATHDRGVRTFVGRAAALARTTAGHRGALADGVRRLPPLLTSLRRSLAPVRRTTSAVRPVLSRLQDAAPALQRLSQTIPAFVRSARPAVRSLGAVAADGRRAVQASRHVASDLASFARQAPATVDLLDALGDSVRDRGGNEALGTFFYGPAVGGGAYDATSHEATAVLDIAPTCVIANTLPGTQVVPGCSHAYSAPGIGRIPPSNIPPSSSAALRRSLGDPHGLSHFLDYLLGR